MFLPHEPLFPNLDTIRCFPGQNSLLLYIRSFLGPKIHTVHLQLGDAVSDSALLQALSHRYPTLLTVTLQSFFDYQPRYFSVFVRGLRQIERLTVDILDVSAFKHLGELTTLKSLETGLEPPTQAMITNGDIPRFPLLRSLTLILRDTTPDVATAYISLVLGCTVSSLDIDIKATATADQTTTLYTALTTYCSHSELYSLEIENNSQYSRDADIDFNFATYLVPITSLLMLRCFTNLATVCLQSPEGFELDDTTVESLARAWPRLTELILKADVVAMHHSNMTLAGLRAFAQHCPKLEFLYITFNAVLAEAPLLGEHPHARPVQRKLDRLQVGRSPIHTAGDVAAYLSGLFPVLEVVSPFGPVNNSDEEGEARWTIWRQVQDLLPVMHGLRAEEKAIASHRADAEGV